MAQIFVTIAGLIHLYIFALESLFWSKPETNKIFGVSKEQAEHNRLFAFNQGFYNLFLALAALGGVALSLDDQSKAAVTLMSYASFSMLGAGLVLLYSNLKLIRPSLIQGVPPFLGLLCLVIGW